MKIVDKKQRRIKKTKEGDMTRQLSKDVTKGGKGGLPGKRGGGGR